VLRLNRTLVGSASTRNTGVHGSSRFARRGERRRHESGHRNASGLVRHARRPERSSWWHADIATGCRGSVSLPGSDPARLREAIEPAFCVVGEFAGTPPLTVRLGASYATAHWTLDNGALQVQVTRSRTQDVQALGEARTPLASLLDKLTAALG
jgi:hypothetical protein